MTNTNDFQTKLIDYLEKNNIKYDHPLFKNNNFELSKQGMIIMSLFVFKRLPVYIKSSTNVDDIKKFLEQNYQNVYYIEENKTDCKIYGFDDKLITMNI